SGEFKALSALGTSPDLPMGGLLSPDDKTFYVRNPKRIIAFDLASGQQHSVFTLSRSGSIVRSALSDDGRVLALVIQDDNAFVVARVAADGTDYRELYTASSIGTVNIAWTKDYSAILIGLIDVKAGVVKLMRIPERGGQPEFTGLDGNSDFFRGYFSL